MVGCEPRDARGMDDDHELVLVAAYPDVERAASDFHELEKRIKHGLELRAAALVTKDAEGQPHVLEAHNRHGRVALGMGAGLGILFGLFLPPVGLAVVVGERQARWWARSPSTSCASVYNVKWAAHSRPVPGWWLPWSIPTAADPLSRLCIAPPK